MSQKKIIGRPKLPDSEARKTVFPLRMSTAEHELLKDASAMENQPLSAWARKYLIAKAKRIMNVAQ